MNIEDFFKIAIEKGAADLHLAGGSMPAVRIGDQLIKIADAPLNGKELEEAVLAL